MPRISIIIPVWNLWETTLQCLESIKANTDEQLLQHIEVLVVNNGSSDETTTALSPTLARLFGKQGQEITLSENLGFAKACNIGAKMATAPLLFFLNNDTICTKNYLPPLIEALKQNPRLGIVGPLLLYPNNTVQHAGVCFSPFLEVMHAYHYLPTAYVVKQKQRFWQAVTAAAMLMPATLFAECNGFYEGYINGFEDLDLCCQIREKGYLLSVVHKSIIYHHTSQTPGRFAHDSENADLLRKRFAGSFSPDQHTIILKNNLLPILSPTLELYAGLPVIKEQALTQVFTNNFDPPRCQASLENEPYWLSGYALMGAYFEEQQLWDKALDAYLSLARLAPLLENFMNLLRCAKLSGNTYIIPQAQLNIEDINNILTHKNEELHRKALKLKQRATENNDMPLASIYDTWLKNNI